MMNFIDSIIYYSMRNILIFENMRQEVLSASLNKSNEKFALKLYKNSNSIISKIKIYS